MDPQGRPHEAGLGGLRVPRREARDPDRPPGDAIAESLRQPPRPRKASRVRHRLFLTVLVLCALHGRLPASALTPAEILVVVNDRVAGGRELAAHYMRARGVPADNLIALQVSRGETMPRREYEEAVAAPIRRAVEARAESRPVRCLLLMFGMPLRVLPPEPAPEEIARLEALGQWKRMVAAELDQRAENTGPAVEGLKRRLAEFDAEALRLSKADQSAALESELMLVASGPYPLSGWVPNPLFLPHRGKNGVAEGRSVIMASRLDGPDLSTVRRMIDDSLAAEATGLDGRACFDARWPASPEAPKDPYLLFDRAIHRAAAILRASGRIAVTLEETGALFQPGRCPDPGLYCGWYSLGRYVDAFGWKPGAVGYHVASSECVSLKTPANTQWCQRLLESGAAATIGPVEEPYLQAFPPPDLFFGLLVGGRLTLAECYAASTPFLSWRMVLIGDPLYRPFARSAAGPKADGAADDAQTAAAPPREAGPPDRRPPR